ncbi:PRC-barrel domain-containing protein [Modicisalibacter xianhensis]|uniref:PRC-barrel domain-containing protein n=1 Tax=Modicisalibacter xianhensis TaxID=442341 RepID=A0A1I2Z0A6_9GAMM|nr:PRC-barrel domain-containing protein [Halomonas xianhensis]SFH30896.1 PRC-barrel domain-containing protein [Halomonas xianhensis]
MTYRNATSALALAIASALAMSQVQAQHNADWRSQNQDQQGQQQSQQRATQGLQVKPLGQWDQNAVYEQGQFLGENLLDQDVLGQNGEDIGDISNAVLNEQNKIIALIAEVGGFWDMGDTHVIVPWEQARFTRNGVHLPINEDNLEQYQLYGENSVVKKQAFQKKAIIEDDADTGQRTWKLTDLINDYSNLSNGAAYGYVNNAVFAKDGQLLAVIVVPSGVVGRGGPMAYPFYGYESGWAPGDSTFEVPYSDQERSQLSPFDFQRFQGFWSGQDNRN